MKKIVLCVFTLVFLVAKCLAQPTAGLIAHWDFNGTTNDVSGHGHNGHGNNITPAVGMDGVAGHGYYFNGVNSWVSVPYSPAFNVNGYSICARLLVQGYYSGTCHANIILVRGKTGLGNCVYMLQFNDAPAGVDCSSTVDTSNQVFWSGASAPSATLSPASLSSFDYSPKITSGRWYTVIATFNDTTFKIYVNGVLKSTAHITNPGLAMGSGTDSISIGYALKEASSGYPYPFKGIIDDISLYNRPLTDSEATHYGDTCGAITAQPYDAGILPGGSVTLSVGTTIALATYQWQQDAGTGFVSLSNAGVYSGVNTASLTIAGATTALHHNIYRCIITNAAGCTDTSNTARLSVSLLVDDIELLQSIRVFPNPVNDLLNIEIPELLKDCDLELRSVVGNTLIARRAVERSTNLDLSALPKGVYFLRVLTARGNKTMEIIR